MIRASTLRCSDLFVTYDCVGIEKKRIIEIIPIFCGDFSVRAWQRMYSRTLIDQLSRRPFRAKWNVPNIETLSCKSMHAHYEVEVSLRGFHIFPILCTRTLQSTPRLFLTKWWHVIKKSSNIDQLLMSPEWHRIFVACNVYSGEWYFESVDFVDCLRNIAFDWTVMISLYIYG